MDNVIKKWGNSAALRVPSSVMAESGLRIDDPVEVRVEGGRIVIEPAAAPPPRLDHLLDGVRLENLHDEADFGAPVGREAFSMAGYVPEAGDIVWRSFTPQPGREQAGHRPAVVLSPAA